MGLRNDKATFEVPAPTLEFEETSDSLFPPGTLPGQTEELKATQALYNDKGYYEVDHETPYPVEAKQPTNETQATEPTEPYVVNLDEQTSEQGELPLYEVNFTTTTGKSIIKLVPADSKQVAVKLALTQVNLDDEDVFEIQVTE